jgi:hypothetical protein
MVLVVEPIFLRFTLLFFFLPMTSGIQNLFETIKGVSRLLIIRASDNSIIQLPPPTGFQIDNQISEKTPMTQNAQGETTRAFSYISARMPVLKMVYDQIQPDTLQFKIGNQFESNTETVSVIKSITPLQETYAGLTDASKIGYAVVQDTPSQAAIKRNIVSVQLTQQPFATFDPTVNESFAVGTALALKFSNDIVTRGDVVQLITTQSVTGYEIGDTLVGVCQIRAVFVTTNNQIVTFSANNTTPSFNGSTINLDSNNDKIELPFFINDDPSGCQPYQIVYTGKYISCF